MQEYFPLSTNGTPPPGHIISLQPTFTVTNLLPYGFHFCFLKKEKYVPPGKEVSIHTVSGSILHTYIYPLLFEDPFNTYQIHPFILCLYMTGKLPSSCKIFNL